MGLEYLQYLFGGVLYLSSATYRRRKQAPWEQRGQGQKIFDLGMWITLPSISLLALFIALFIV